jgi:hypothetical protein
MHSYALQLENSSSLRLNTAWMIGQILRGQSLGNIFDGSENMCYAASPATIAAGELLN